MTLRGVLKRDLLATLKARDDANAVSALRTAISAIDNAGAVEAPLAPLGGAEVVTVGVGVGSTDVARRELSEEDVRAILRAQIDEQLRAAAGYDAAGQTAAAIDLRDQAAVLAKYL